MNIKEYLKTIDEVIAEGKFKDNWQSLHQFKMPSWYKDGRFGLFIHWGCYSVPAVESEWYPRQMYIKGSKSWNHRVKTYGENGDYRKVVESFKPTKFDADEWLKIFKASGAKYIMPVAEHHDGVKMYESHLNRWNTMELNGRDYMLELKKACEKADVGFLASNHRAEHFWFLNGARKNCPESEITKNLYPELYGPAKLHSSGNVNDDQKLTVTTEWLEDWLVSSCDMIDRLKPLAVYFDWWIYMADFKPYLKKFLAYYYNRGIEWNKEVGVFYKNGAVMNGCAIFDVERGQIDNVSPVLWQNDTAIAKNSWGYTEGNDFKTAKDIVKNMIEVISKNGCYMLNVGPKADGTVCPEEKAVLLKIGKWLTYNGEAIYGSYPFEINFEGKKKKNGSFCENIKYTSKDYCFTYKPNAIYVFPMFDKAPKKGYLVNCLKSMEFAGHLGIRYDIKGVTLLGHDNKISYSREKSGLRIFVDGEISTDMPLCFKIIVD